MFRETFLLVVYTFHIQFYFSEKRQRKSTKNLSKNVIENLFLLFEVKAREDLGTQSTLAREHITTEGTLAREYVCMQGTLAREHARDAI